MIIPHSHHGHHGYCHLPFNKIKINPYGEVTNCCWMNKPIGNILHQSLEEIWNGSMISDIRESITNYRLHPVCQGVCPYNFKPLAERPVQFTQYPAFLEFDLPNTHCNIGGVSPKPHTACIMCSRASPKFSPSDDLCNQIAVKYAPYTKYLREVHIQGIAEPFWKGRIFDILILLEAYPDLRVSVITNGILLTNQILEQWLQISHTHMTISIDAATSATYQHIRKAAAFDTITQNIHQFNRRKTSNQVFALNANINIFNVHEVVSMVDLAAEVQASFLALNTTDVIDESMAYMVVNASNAHIFAKAQEDAQKRAEQLGVDLRILKPLSLNYCVN